MARIPAAPERPSLERLTPPLVPDRSTAALIRARQTAIAALEHTPRSARQPLNPLVLPAELIGRQGILVYLLPGTSKPRTGILGQHFRALISEDGAQVVEMMPLSISAIEFPIPDDVKDWGFTLNHSVTDWLLETHVFSSLRYRLPMVLVTGNYLWRIQGSRIAAMPRLCPEPGSLRSFPRTIPVTVF